MTSSVISVKRVRPLLGTFVEITLRGPAKNDFLQRCVTRGFTAIAEVDRLMSIHRADSDISRLNQAKPGMWVKINPLTLNVLRAANTLYTATAGLFDIRLLPSSPAVSGRGRHFGPPTETFGGDDIFRARKLGPWVFDLGGIAKGFAVDQAVEAMQRMTLKRKISGIVNAGGDLRIWGKLAAPIAVRIDGEERSWTKPLQASPLAMATSAVRRTDAATPVSYRNLKSGHTLRRADTATVVAERCLWADALTKVVLLGDKALTARCLSSYGARAILYDGAGRTRRVFR